MSIGVNTPSFLYHNVSFVQASCSLRQVVVPCLWQLDWCILSVWVDHCMRRQPIPYYEVPHGYQPGECSGLFGHRFCYSTSKSNHHRTELLQHGPELNVRLFTVVGFCGSMTTFSTYPSDTYGVIYCTKHQWSHGLCLAAMDIVVNNVACFSAVLLAYRAGKLLKQQPLDDDTSELQYADCGPVGDDEIRVGSA